MRTVIGKDVQCYEIPVYGYISTSERGTNGFGFDPIFELENGKTIAELTDEEKDEINSRKKAIEKIKF